ncbi:helix-turn-helix transcriptional regulator [Paenibacillus bovis]|uniref:Transcriptional regulator n=1 Tax=Paenibacillus bovis TaxID=1616788 RepID=A0A172ZHL3_9BACL|nr:YafY family protein [Paenibacillus bovis]ANF96640.1 transcriptional regulator [Paenibacillus bovis]
MKKSERLNDMIRYLNGREFFNLSDLMSTYRISKSTALRDIHSLEQLGMPLYAEHGRYGRYGILKNRLLSPMIFTMDEVYALYFAMLTLEAYQSTPFHLSGNRLNEKFENCLSPTQIEQIHNMQKVLQLETYPHTNTSLCLDRILKSILHERSCEISYTRGKQRKTYTVQFARISARFGQWYATGIDLEQQQYKIFRCDRIHAVEENISLPALPLDDLLQQYSDRQQSDHSVPFEVTITAQGRDIFDKEHYPSMRLQVGKETVIRGFYNPGEEKFIADYFIRYGQHIQSVQPDTLKKMIRDRIHRLLDHYNQL